MPDFARVARFGAAGRALAILLLAGAPAACFTRSEPEVPGTPPEEFRAALTELTVVNQTTMRLSIGFRTAAIGRSTIVGYIEPGQTTRTAPIPAGEPVALVAREPAGGEYTLAPHSFPVGGAWTWEIPATAAFRRPDP